MRAEQSVLAPRRSQLAVSTAFRGPSGRFHLAEDARRGNHDLATAGHPGNVGYPKPVLANALKDDAALARRVWEFLDSIPPETLLGEGRVYGGGLYKMEPSELANVPADAIAAMLPARPASQAEMFEEDAAA